MANDNFRNTAYVIKVGDDWFAGFGGKPGQETLTKLKPGLCDAKLMWDHKKAAEYLDRLRKRGYGGVVTTVSAA